MEDRVMAGVTAAQRRALQRAGAIRSGLSEAKGEDALFALCAVSSTRSPPIEFYLVLQRAMASFHVILESPKDGALSLKMKSARANALRRAFPLCPGLGRTAARCEQCPLDERIARAFSARLHVSEIPA